MCAVVMYKRLTDRVELQGIFFYITVHHMLHMLRVNIPQLSCSLLLFVPFHLPVKKKESNIVNNDTVTI